MESLYCHYILVDKEGKKEDKSENRSGYISQSRAGSVIRSRSGSQRSGSPRSGPLRSGSHYSDNQSGHHSGEGSGDEESKGSFIEETPSAFNEDKLQKISGDTDIPLDLHPEEEVKVADVEVSVRNEKVFTQEEETQMLDERR